ncbi:hypothetical protein G6D29_000710 [Salmonella enterica]|nr:hypothetical protein [Salmonella enterica]EEO7309970.1 hypothetical protein [Salmonella enterica]
MINQQHTTHFAWSENNQSETASLLEDILSHQSYKSPEFVNAIPELIVGRIVSVSDSGKFQIQCSSAEKPVTALSLGIADQTFIGRMCTIQFICGNPSYPVVTGILPDEWATVQSQPIINNSESNVLDTKRVVLEAEQELVFQCGESKIILSADGLVQIRALYIDNQAQATLRLKGGSVQVN